MPGPLQKTSLPLGLFLLLAALALQDCTKPNLNQMKIQLERFQYHKSQGDWVMGELRVRIINENDIPVIFQMGQVEAFLNQSPIGQLEQEERQEIAPGEAVGLPVAVKIKKSGLIAGAITALLGDRIKVEVKGKLKIKIYGIMVPYPFERSYQARPSDLLR